MIVDNWKAYLGFAGGVLVFLAAIINVLNGYYSKLDKHEQKLKFWFTVQMAIIFLCTTVGFYISLFTKYPLGLILLGIGVIGASIQFIRLPEPATRKEIVLLIFIISSLVFAIYAH